jgi:hypothetical protein
MALDTAKLTSLFGAERFLYPSAALLGTGPGQEQLWNSTMEEAGAAGWLVINGTIARTTASQFRTGFNLRFTKGVAGGTSAWVYQRWKPPSGLMFPSTRRIVGPLDTLAANLAIGATTVQVSNPSRWPDYGTAVFEHTLRNSSGGRPMEEFSWNGKNGSGHLINVQRNLRNENNNVQMNAGELLIGTSYLRRKLFQCWVLPVNANGLKARMEAHPMYEDGLGGQLYANTGTVGPTYTMQQNQWNLLELVYDFTEANLADPGGPTPDQIEVRLVHHDDNANTNIFYLDEFRAYHILELPKRDPNPIDPAEDVGESFERTAGGDFKSGRTSARVTNQLLSWGRGNPLSTQEKNWLINWHRDLAYEDQETSRSFDFQGHLDGLYGFPLEQHEVMWADTRPLFQEIAGTPPLWATKALLEQITENTTGITRGGLK